MSKHHIPINPVGTIHPEYVAPNNATVSPSGMAKIAQAFSYTACLQKKVILVRAQDHLNLSSAGTNFVVWPHYFRTGENTSVVVARVGIAGVDSGTHSSVTYKVRVFSAGDISDTLVGEVTHDNGHIVGSSCAPNDVSRRLCRVTGLSPNTEYHGYFSMSTPGIGVGNALLTYAVVHEELTSRSDDTLTGVCSPDKYHAEAPIYDLEAQDLTDANNKLWRHNGAPYIGWAADYDTSSGPTTTSAVFADLQANSAGHYIDSTYDCTRNRTTVPVKMGVKAFRDTNTATADFRLTDGTNNVDITGCVCPTAANEKWFTTTATIPAGTGTWRMQARRTAGTGTITVCGWALFPYES